MKREKKTIICSLIFIVVAGVLYQCRHAPVSIQEEICYSEVPVITAKQQTEELQTMDVQVSAGRSCCYICGAVNKPGVYDFTEEIRLNEIIEMAGGFTADAASTYLNLAGTVTDGEKIYVPTLDEVMSMVPDGTAVQKAQEEIQNKEVSSTEDKININTADIDILTTLPGIGEAKAGRIVSYRDEHGGFQSIEELKDIEGIKEGIFDKIKDLIAVQ